MFIGTALVLKCEFQLFWHKLRESKCKKFIKRSWSIIIIIAQTNYQGHIFVETMRQSSENCHFAKYTYTCTYTGAEREEGL